MSGRGNAKRAFSLHPNLAPRGLRRQAAAEYIGVSPTKFDDLVKQKRMPAPREIDACRVWDQRELDVAFDNLAPFETVDVNPFDRRGP